EDPEPLQQNINELANGNRDVLLLTSAHQIVNMLRMAERLNMVDRLRQGLASTMIASIGPTTSQMLQECDLHVDMEPSHPKMGHLVTEAAQRCGQFSRQRKRRLQAASLSELKPTVAPILESEQRERHPSEDSLFMKACRGEPTERTPIWLMRQAGRYMSEYRAVRSNYTFLDLCSDPQACSEIMCTAVEKLKVDVAIIFSDLLPILVPMGFHLEFVAGDGPVIHNPIKDVADVDRVTRLDDPGELGFVYETVAQTRADLPEWMPLIGFSGSPFTLASYAIEGGGSRQYTKTKALMHSDPAAWSALMDKLSHAIVVYLNEQIVAGAQCVQLFDSWAGCLSPSDYDRFVAPWMQQILSGVHPGVPVINFATGNPELLPLLRGDSRTVVGVDWRIDLAEAWKRIGSDKSVQGNMDPAVLLGPREQIRHTVWDLLESVKGRSGHIFNLGHGVLKETKVENAIALVEDVKELSTRLNEGYAGDGSA
ncbi:MAG: uroporphyrinogen decarboxylase, partial [Planctomycetota bacterium]